MRSSKNILGKISQDNLVRSHSQAKLALQWLCWGYLTVCSGQQLDSLPATRSSTATDKYTITLKVSFN